MNGGTCIDQVNGYNCLCTAGYTGQRCDTGKPASTSFCLILPEGRNYDASIKKDLKHGCPRMDVAYQR